MTDYGKLKVPKSDGFEAIMRQYELVGRSISDRKFYEKFVATIDPSIKLSAWQQFMLRMRKDVKARREELIKRVQDGELNELKMEEDAMKGVLAISNITVNEIMKNPALLEKIPVKERLGFLFKAMKSRDSRATVALKKNAEDRKATMFEDLIKGAQYGEIINDETKSIDKPKEEETVEFSPEQVEEHA